MYDLFHVLKITRLLNRSGFLEDRNESQDGGSQWKAGQPDEGLQAGEQRLSKHCSHEQEVETGVLVEEGKAGAGRCRRGHPNAPCGGG